MSPVRELPSEAHVINLGLPDFAAAVAAQGAEAIQVDWSLPAGGDPTSVAALTALYGVRSISIDDANAEIVRRLDKGTPFLTGVAPAGEVVPGLGDRMLLHAGPPIAYEQVCDPMRRSMRAAVVAEGWAADLGAAEELLARGVELLAEYQARPAWWSRWPR